jgi:hypothetical protein
MPRNKDWTLKENLAIYYHLYHFPSYDAKTLAEYLYNSEELHSSRTEHAIYLHVLKLIKLKDRLVIPDPVHEFDPMEEPI